MPILTTSPVNSVPTTPPPGEALLRLRHGPRQRLRGFLGALRHYFRGPPPLPIQRTDAQVARDAGHRLQQEVASASGCQGITVEVEQGIATLYGSVDTTWRKERLAALVLSLPGVQQVTNYMLAEEAVSEQIENRFQSLLTAGTLERLPRFLIEHRIVEVYGEVASSEKRALVEREALAVPGVRVVLNHLRLPQESGTPVHTTNR